VGQRLVEQIEVKESNTEPVFELLQLFFAFGMK
jgi:hypothetical protein